jgi:hypothetical protein
MTTTAVVTTSEKTLGKTSSINSFEKITGNDAIQSVIEQGKVHMENLFNYKSVINGLIQVKGDAENKKELYSKNLELLSPQVQKMRDLSTYTDTLMNTTVGYLSSMIKSEQPPTPEQLKTLVQVLDVFVILDYLKTWQAGLNNDFSMYRRAVQHVKKDYNMSEDENLRFFLINPNNINKGLKKALQEKVKGFEKVLVYLIKYCADEFEKDDQQSHYLRIAVFWYVVREFSIIL